MTSQPSGLAPPPEPERHQAVRHAEVALRSMGQPNSVASAFDFWDDSYEGRRLFSELLGTFFLVLVAAGGGMVSARFGGNAVPYGAKVVAPALMVMAIILFMGTVSGAHLNPAVSIAFAARGDFPWKRVPAYVVTQFLGAIAATLLLWALLGKQGSAGLTLPGPGPAREARQPGLPDRVLRYGIWLAVVTRSLGDRRFQASVITGVIGAYALASLIKNNQARPVRRAIHWYSMEGQIRNEKGLHHTRQSVQPTVMVVSQASPGITPMRVLPAPERAEQRPVAAPTAERRSRDSPDGYGRDKSSGGSVRSRRIADVTRAGPGSEACAASRASRGLPWTSAGLMAPRGPSRVSAARAAAAG